MSAPGVVVVAELGEWATQWDRLVDLLPLPTPFLRSWWLNHVAVGEPAIVLVVDGNRLVGGAAFQLQRRRGCDAVSMLGDGPLAPDHLDLVAVPGRTSEVIEAVATWLARPGSRVIDLVGLVEGAWIIEAMPRAHVAFAHEMAPYAPLPSTWEAYVAERPGKVRSTISRASKRLAKAGIVARPSDLSTPAAIDDALVNLRRLHDTRWGDASAFLDAWPHFAAAMTAGVPSGDVRFTELATDDDTVVAIELELWAGGRAGFYQAGRLEDRDLRGSGSVLKAKVLRDALDAGAVEFDLLRGGESYKAEWATAQRTLWRAIGGVGPRGLAVAAAVEGRRRVQRRKNRRSAAPGAESG